MNDVTLTVGEQVVRKEIPAHFPRPGEGQDLCLEVGPTPQEDVILRLHALLSAFQESTIDGILVVDERWQIISCNQRFRELWQVPEEIILSRDDDRLLRHAVSLMQEPEAFFAQVMEMYENPTEHSCDEIILKCGKVFDRYSAPVLAGGGRVLGRIWYFRDVTDRRQAAAELQAEVVERQWAEIEMQRVLAQSEQILASITSILITVDQDGAIVTWNRAATEAFNIEASEMLGTPFVSCGIRWDWSVVGAAIETCILEQRAVRIDNVHYVCSNGRERALGVTVNPIDRYCDSPKGFLILGADITDRRVMEGQLAHAQKMESIGHLAAGIAHEINTPIQYAGDNLRFLQESIATIHPLLDTYRKFVQMAASRMPDASHVFAIEEAERDADLDYLLTEIPCAIMQSLEGVDRVSHIVRAMKDFSHPGTADKVLTDINRALASTITIASNEWKYVAELATEFERDLPPVSCLPADINQVFLNILVNAAHAIGDVVGDGSNGKGKITVRTRCTSDYVEVEIADTGGGMSEDIKQRIFDPFFTTKEVGRGTGQGLAISHAVVVEKHGGTISVQTQVGKGTAFQIQLPLTDSKLGVSV